MSGLRFSGPEGGHEVQMHVVSGSKTVETREDQLVTTPKTNVLFGPTKTKYWMAGLFFFLPFGIYLHSLSRTTMKDDVMAVRRMGIPMTMDDLSRKIPRTGQSAAPDYEQFAGLVGDGNSQHRRLLARRMLDDNATMAIEYNDTGHHDYTSPHDEREAIEELKTFVAPIVRGASKPRYTLVAPKDNPLPQSESFTSYTFIHDQFPILFDIVHGEASLGSPRAGLPYLRAAISFCHQVGQNPGYEQTAMTWESEVLKQYVWLEHEMPEDKSLQRQIVDDMSHLPSLPSIYNVYVQTYWTDLQQLDGTLNGPISGEVGPTERLVQYWRRANSTQPVADQQALAWLEIFKAMSPSTNWTQVSRAIHIAQKDFTNDTKDSPYTSDIGKSPDFHYDVVRPWQEENALRDTVKTTAISLTHQRK